MKEQVWMTPMGDLFLVMDKTLYHISEDGILLSRFSFGLALLAGCTYLGDL